MPVGRGLVIATMSAQGRSIPDIADACDGSEVAVLLLAVAVKVCAVPFNRPVTVHVPGAVALCTHHQLKRSRYTGWLHHQNQTPAPQQPLLHHAQP